MKKKNVYPKKEPGSFRQRKPGCEIVRDQRARGNCLPPARSSEKGEKSPFHCLAAAYGRQRRVKLGHSRMRTTILQWSFGEGRSIGV